MKSMTAAGTLLGLSLLLAACGGGGATTAPATAVPATATAAPSQAPASAPAAAGAASVNLGDTSLGKVLVDGKGMTLYIFTADSGGASACYDKCAGAWPPLLSDGSAPTLGAGLDAGDFATIDRTDGTKQVTFYGMPLYFFSGDKAAGDVAGQGLNSKWYVIGADGKPVK